MIERLTKRNSNGDVASHVDPQKRYMLFVNRLAAYEDSGLSPEEIYRLKAKNEALEADKGIVEASHINTEMNNEHLSERIEQLEELVKACRSRLPNISHFCTCGKCKTCGKQINYVNYIYCDDCLAKAIDALIGGKEDV